MSLKTGKLTGRIDIGQGLIVVGGLVAVIGAFLPWLTAGGEFGDVVSASGWDVISDVSLPVYSPIATVGLAILAIVLTVGVPNNDIARGGEIFAGVVIAIVGLIFVVSPETVLGGGLKGEVLGAVTKPGIGIFATLAAGVLIAVGGVVNMSE